MIPFVQSLAEANPAMEGFRRLPPFPTIPLGRLREPSIPLGPSGAIPGVHAEIPPALVWHGVAGFLRFVFGTTRSPH
jgi:hypothetical protein